MKLKKLPVFFALLVFCSIWATGCTTTDQENGVTISKNHGVNPLNFNPFSK